MCGVIGLVFERHRSDLGRVAAELLKQLEYRGYDSTGAAIQGEGLTVKLAKGVGAPSEVVDSLGITEMSGRTMVGQVRWATFGAVDEKNSQPHVMSCHTFLFGAHNGNVTNCDDLKVWLTREGHDVKSDNDGEMLVHTVEHYFARELERTADATDAAQRRRCMRTAICAASRELRGSYAAVIADPTSRVLWAIKNGSSLYFGVGEDELGGHFGIASSDLSAVLRLTRVLIPISEGEFVEFEPTGHQVYRLGDVALPVDRSPIRSRLRAKETGLLPGFETFMDQEISAQEKTCRDVVTTVLGGSDEQKRVAALLEQCSDDDLAQIHGMLDEVRAESLDAAVQAAFHRLLESAPFEAVLDRIPSDLAEQLQPTPERLVSGEGGFLTDLIPAIRDAREGVAIKVIDAILEREEVIESQLAYERFCRLAAETVDRRGRIFVLCCGSSYHAARAGALYFDEIAHVEIVPVRPGDFRGQHSRSLRDGDLIVAVSQSGETKDLIDVLNDVAATRLEIRCVALVNNINSTLAQEKSDLVIPLRCGPEIAVPATKSFMNQMVVFYCLALKLGEMRVATSDAAEEATQQWRDEIERRTERLPRLPQLIRETVESTEGEIERAATGLFLAPSIHVLATRITAVAEEGALKVREVVLNHTEGYEASEFKHGPNTILGFNTLFGPHQVEALVSRLGEAQASLVERSLAAGLSADATSRVTRALAHRVFNPSAPELDLDDAERRIVDDGIDREELLAELYADYPLIFVTGPDERDVHLTVSQVNTHKIRGASVVMIAEDDKALRQAAQKAPTNNPNYRSVYVTLPRTGDTLLTTFSSTVVLQRLALRMSLMKKAYLDRLGIREHGVHPDVPKNVSKSITVD